MSIVPIGDRQATPYDPSSFAPYDLSSFALFDPFFDFPFASSLSSLFPDFPLPPWGSTRTSIDYKETSGAHIIRARLPGMSRDDVEVEVDGDHVVKIIGRGGHFLSSFTLPENARMDLVQANMNDGYLVVAVPKFERRRDNVRVVEITGDE